MSEKTAEQERLAESRPDRLRDWRLWGPYLSERQWGTVREDYSPHGTAWEYFPHDHARSRAYRWGEDGLLGLCDRQGRLCFALALWNGRDPILKERLFGLTGPEGNHGEDVKECYFYLDSTPTHSYMKALYKYPQGEFPYARLLAEARRRTRDDPERERRELETFLERYGHRAVAEIDLGLPRWSEDPSHLRNAIAGARAVDAGPLRFSRFVEQITILLIGINGRYKTHSHVRIVGLDHRPG